MIIVSNNNDSGANSLRQAIIDAALGEEITFSITGTITLTTGELVISQDVIITGPGSGSLTVSGNVASRIFNITNGVVSISGMTIINGVENDGGGIFNDGTLTLDDIDIVDCSANSAGGGIYNDSTVIATDLNIVTCTATATGAAYYNAGTLTWTNGSMLHNASVNGAGGGYSDGTATLTLVVVTDNTSDVGTGGAFENQGTVDLVECTVNANFATGSGMGMAIYNQFGTVTLTRTTVNDHNQASSTAIHNDSGSVNIINSTVSGNTVGIYNDIGAVDFTFSTITQNNTGLVQTSGSIGSAFDTILAGNTLDYDGDTADFTSNGHNIFGVNTNPITPTTGDQSVLSFAALVMGPLQNNGGPTETHALLAGSPALDDGDGTGAPSTDQRGVGFPRVINGVIDIGAFEADIEPEPPEPPTPTPTPTPPAPFPEPPAPPIVPSDVRTCPIPASPCTRPEEPIINSSSESPDTVDFFSGMVYGYGDWDPPLNKGFVTAVGCGVTCSAPTQQEADECAARLANSCEEDQNPEPEPDERFPSGGGGSPFPPIDPGVPTVVRPLFGNEAYTAFTTCSDGTQSSYTVAAGTFTALTQAQANSMAHAFGDKQVIALRWCINPITPLHCLNQPVSGFFSATGYNPQVPIQPYPITLVSGAFPTGVSFFQFEPGIWTATGNATQSGFFTFTVQITNGDGTTKTSTMNMLIWGITKELPDPEIDVPYSEQMTSSGGLQSVTYSVTSGTLPTGLTLSASGLLSGTPTEDGIFFFIIQASATDPLGSGTCSKEYTLEVEPESECPVLESNLVVTLVNSSSAYAVNSDRVIVTANGVVSVLNPVTAAVETTGSALPQLIKNTYCSIPGRVWAEDFINELGLAADIYSINTTTGVAALIATGGMHTTYDPDDNSIYAQTAFREVTRYDADTGAVQAVYTDALVSKMATAPGQGAPYLVSNRVYFPIWDVTGIGLSLFNYTTGAWVGHSAAIDVGEQCGACIWHVDSGLIVVMSLIGAQYRIRTYNPATNSWLETINIPDLNISGINEQRCMFSTSPNTNLVYVREGLGDVLVVQVSPLELLCTISNGVYNFSNAVDSTRGKLWIKTNTNQMTTYDE